MATTTLEPREEASEVESCRCLAPVLFDDDHCDFASSNPAVSLVRKMGGIAAEISTPN